MDEPKNVYVAISAVLLALSKIGIDKDNFNESQKFRFRGIDQMYAAISPLLAEHGLLLLPRVVGRELTSHPSKSGGVNFRVSLDVEYDFVSVLDSSKHTIRLSSEAMDSGDKATNKALSAAYKYACIQVFCIPLKGDPDADASTPEETVSQAEVETISQEQGAILDELITKSGSDFKAFAKFYGIEKLRDVPAAKFERIRNTLLRKIAPPETAPAATAKAEPVQPESTPDTGGGETQVVSSEAGGGNGDAPKPTGNGRRGGATKFRGVRK